VQQLWHLYALFIAMAVGFTLSSPTTVTKMVSPWFQRRRSLALAIAHSGAAMGEMVLVPAAGLALVVWGWRSAYVALGVLLFILAPIVWRLLSNAPDSADPDEVGAADDQDGSPALSRTERALEGLSLRSTIRLPMFWRLTAGFFA
jgi:predicted MFS family arabinose efflux permease